MYTSPTTLLELNEGAFPGQLDALELMSPIPLLAPDVAIDGIVVVYLENRLMPSYDIRDAIHLAFASFFKIDYLLTWNCRHLANVRKQEHIRIINGRLRLSTPAIITPLELRLPEEE